MATHGEVIRSNPAPVRHSTCTAAALVPHGADSAATRVPLITVPSLTYNRFMSYVYSFSSFLLLGSVTHDLCV